MRNSRLVYSSDGGPHRPPRPRTFDRGDDQPPAIPNDGVVRIFRERRGRGGKTVTVVRGLPDRGARLDARAAELKRLCGAGGAVRPGIIEIQGDHRERLAAHLREQGLTVKLAGG
jgi:translation initiation factor 1